MLRNVFLLLVQYKPNAIMAPFIMVLNFSYLNLNHIWFWTADPCIYPLIYKIPGTTEADVGMKISN